MPKRKTPPKFKSEEEMASRSKAREDLHIPDMARKEIGKEEADENAEKALASLKAAGLIAPEQPKPWEVLHPDAHKRTEPKEGAKMGRPVLFETPDVLRDAVMAYFKHVYDNPEYEAVFKDGLVRYMPKRPLLTLDGLRTYLGTGPSFWRDKRDEMKDNPDFSAVFEWADQIVRNNKITGATLGFFKENIVAREYVKEHVVTEVGAIQKSISDLFPDDLDLGEVGVDDSH